MTGEAKWLSVRERQHARVLDGSSQVVLFLNTSLTLPLTSGNQTGLAL